MAFRSHIYKFLILSFFMLLAGQVYASHLIGGEIGYSCISPGVFRVKLTLYQDCIEGITAVIEEDNPAHYIIYEKTPAPRRATSGTEYSVRNRIIPPEFSNDCISNYPNTCLREEIFEFDVSLPPSEYGYVIVYQRCCRNMTVQNVVNPGLVGVTYYADIPPFGAGECPNNSPAFNNTPPQIICRNNPFTYDFSAEDTDGDSLVYRLCTPYAGASQGDSKPADTHINPPPFTSVPFGFGYNFTNPIPGFPPLFIHPETGIMTIIPSSSGRYLVAVCVDEYREGILINTQSRDLQFIITDCSKNVIANTPLYSEEPNTYIINCTDFTVRFDNSSSGGFNYEWDFGDGSPRSNAFEPVHTYTDTGTYIITLIVNKGSTCSDSIQRIVKIYPELNVHFDYNGDLCPDHPVLFIESITSSLDDTYYFEWDFGNGTTSRESRPTVIYETGGEYRVTLTVYSEFGCVVQHARTLNIRDFKPHAGNDTIIVLGYDYALNATGGDIFEWFPKDYLSDPYIANPKVSFPDTGMYTYYVQVGTDENCNGTDTINILVVERASILLPNAFSPNGDGLNDEIRPMLIGFPFTNYFRIYNRYGQLVFVTYSHHTAWDGSMNGKPCDAGVYYYEISVKNLQGTDTFLTGDITLIR